MKMFGVIKLVVVLIIVLANSGSYSQKGNRTGMVKISGGNYVPLYKSEGPALQKINSFYMDIFAVTNSEYLEFVKANPKWQRSKVKRIFADESYLNHWQNDLVLGENVNSKSPVTNISWFVANAYAKWKGKRLPTIAEWEYVAAANKTNPNAGDDPELVKTILDWYSHRSLEKLPNVGTTDKNYWGVYDIHGIIWEWVYDFNTALVSGESRGDGSIERNLFCGSGSLNATNVRNYPAFMRFGFRSSLKANYCVNNLGFRCVQDINNKIEVVE